MRRRLNHAARIPWWGAAIICLELLTAVPAAAAAAPGLDALREAWNAALNDWKSANVEADRDLFRRPVAEALSHIDETMAKRRRLNEAKLQYVMELARSCRAFVRQWEQSPGALSEPPGESGLRQSIAGAIRDLDRQLKALPAGSREAAAVLERQRDEFRTIQTALANRGQSRPGGGLANPADVAPALEAVLAFANRLEAHGVALRQEAEAWDNLYQGLKEEVERRAPRAVAAAATPAPGGTGAPPSATFSQVVVPSLAGVWFLQNLDARKTADGAYEPLFISLRITQQEDRVQGRYEGLYAVPEDEPYNPTVRFSFEGRITAETLRFPLRPPLRGHILIDRVHPSRLRVSYRIENPEASHISFGYVGPDNPQFLQKRID